MEALRAGGRGVRQLQNLIQTAKHKYDTCVH